MKEVEVKAKVHDQNMIRTKLQALGCVLSEPIRQHDQVFLTAGMTLDQVSRGDCILRIRQTDHEIILTLKKQLTNELDNVELELLITDPITAKSLIEHLGFEPVIEIIKTRQTAKYSGMNICLDTVEGLGDFIEVEKMTDAADSLAVQDELFTWLKTLGIAETDRILQGYDTLLSKK
ncbi:class IV adenylate cyclase [Candidatus Falkowbacteria bacterium]|nr:class IV adenylate cyclase [Candidatus Falkowbacteria bacterium]